MRPSSSTNAAFVQLLAHRTLGGSPPQELEWLAARGQFFEFSRGDTLVKPGDVVEETPHAGLWIVLAGRLAVYVDRGTGPRRVGDWSAGDVTGVLPFSRMTKSVGIARALESGVLLEVSQREFPELIRDCPSVTAKLVHVMLDRARMFTSSEL